MKKFLGNMALLGASITLLTAPAWAHHKKNPCRAVWKACVKAGHKGKDAKECVEQIKGGGTVDGVTVSDSDLQACQGSSNGGSGTHQTPPSSGSSGSNGG